MNEEDRRQRTNERDASPVRFPREEAEPFVESEEQEERREELSRTFTASTGSSSQGAAGRHGDAVSRVSTQYEAVHDMERHPTALSRIQTGRSQHSQTIGASIRSRTTTRQSKKPLPNFGGGKPFPPSLPDREEYVVEKKLIVSTVLGFVTLTAAFGSSIFSVTTGTIAAQYGVSSEVGPIVWAPMSELYGRKIPLLVGSFAFTIFSIAVAAGKDLQTILICRFFSGFMGACPLTCVGAVFADLYNNRQRGLAISVFSVAVFSGPLLAPFIGGFINQSYLGWRWTEWLTAIMGATGLILSLLFLEETYPPVILVNKAAEMRRRTKNWGIHAKQEEIEIDLRELLEKNLSRPMRMLFTEPIVLLISIYMAFIYGLLYLFLTFYPIVFQGIHGFNQGVGGLPYFGIIFGELLAGLAVILMQPGYNKKLAANNNVPVPEWRLPIAIVGGTLFAIGLFWFGWSGYRADVHWIVPTLSGLFTGFGLLMLNYLIDSYLMFAASAIAANTFLRSLCGAGFPLFATYMIEGMGVQWAGTLLGCVALLLVPVPLYFYLRGAKIRERSSFAPTFPIASQASGEERKDGDDEKQQ
nr:putative transporter [Quercus suber]